MPQEKQRNMGGRPRRNRPDEVAKAIERMIRDYENTGDIKCLHDVYLLDILGNISLTTLERYYSGEADKALPKDEQYKTKGGYGEAMKKLISYRQAVCVQHIAEDRTVAGWIFLSKQPHWGGFQDIQKQEVKGKQEFKVTICGPDGKAIKE